MKMAPQLYYVRWSIRDEYNLITLFKSGRVNYPPINKKLNVLSPFYSGAEWYRTRVSNFTQ